MIVTIIIPGDPQTKGSWTVQPKRGGGVHLAPGRDRAARDRFEGWMADVQVMARRAMGMRDPMDGALEAHVNFVVPRPKSASRRRWPTSQQDGDLDKLERALYDALQGIVYTNDARICAHHNLKRYVDESAGERPHVHCTIVEMARR